MTYEEAVSAWAAHLRSGGTTPWSAWHPPTADVEVVHPLPDAIHLELARRINLAAENATGNAAGTHAGLVDRVFATASPGRGLLDVPLPWPDSPRRFGTPAYDPSQLPLEELIRLAVGVLAHLLPGVPPPARQRPPHPLPFPWRRRFRLHGSPDTVAVVRRILLEQGCVETDWRPTHVVIARPLEVMMAEHWASSVRTGGILTWVANWRRAEATNRLPARIDVPALADRLTGRPREPLHVVVARDAEEAVTLTTEILGARPATAGSSTDPALSDLLRRLNRLTVLSQGRRQVRRLAQTLVEVVGEDARTQDHTARVATPPAHLPWARKVALTAAERLRHAGYAVHGDPGALAPSTPGPAGTIDSQRILELALMACLRSWHLGGQA